MATKTEITQAEVDTLAALMLAKLGLNIDANDRKTLAKKTPADRAMQTARLQGMRDLNAAPAAVEAATWVAEDARPAGSGNGSRGRAAAPKVSQAKLDYVTSLLIDVWGAEDAAELIAELPSFDGDHISRMIDNLKPLIPATDGQKRFMANLIGEKLAPGSELAAAMLADVEILTKDEAKIRLDQLQALPRYVAPKADGQQTPARRNTPQVEADGMYRNPETGEIFKVQVAMHGSGKLYAKKLVQLDEPTMVRGKEARFAFEMARGAIMSLKPEWKLTREDAKAFGDLYGCCMRCGTVLTDEESIETGLGRVCRGKM